jgi:hypothetical protein
MKRSAVTAHIHTPRWGIRDVTHNVTSLPLCNAEPFNGPPKITPLIGGQESLTLPAERISTMEVKAISLSDEKMPVGYAFIIAIQATSCDDVDCARSFRIKLVRRVSAAPQQKR